MQSRIAYGVGDGRFAVGSRRVRGDFAYMRIV